MGPAEASGPRLSRCDQRFEARLLPQKKQRADERFALGEKAERYFSSLFKKENKDKIKD